MPYKAHYAAQHRRHPPHNIEPLCFGTFADVLKEFHRGRLLHFCPGRIGRVDMFFMQTYTVALNNHTIGMLATQPGDETLRAIELLDDMVKNDDETWFTDEAVVWLKSESKLDRWRADCYNAYFYQRFYPTARLNGVIRRSVSSRWMAVLENDQSSH